MSEGKWAATHVVDAEKGQSVMRQKGALSKILLQQ